MDSSSSLDNISISVSRDEDFVLVSRPKIGYVLIEARLKHGFEQHTFTEKGSQQIQARLERELNCPLTVKDAVISIGADLLRDSNFYGRFPTNMFRSVEVIGFQGFESDTGHVKVRDVELRVIVDREAEAVEKTPFKIRYPALSRGSDDIVDGIWDLC